jgi:hypothetical protein
MIPAGPALQKQLCTAMKTHLTSAITGAAVAAAAFLAVTAARSDQPEVVPPVPTTPPAAESRLTPVVGVEQYKILSLASVQSERDTQRMEEVLNKLAADGWKVRTGVGVALVLSR